MTQLSRLAGSRPNSVVVVGAGFAGTVVSVHLRNSLPPSREITLIERRPAFGRGVAYRTENPEHLLNVHAASMSAFPGEPAHFQNWLTNIASPRTCEVHATPAGIFASRGIYGQYVQSLLQNNVPPSSPRAPLRHLVDDVVDIEKLSGHFRVTCRSGRTVDASGVVLALGNLQGPGADGGILYSNPWSPGATSGLDPGLPVLIIGTGLTAVDLALELQHRRFPGPVIMLSRRGLLPRPHAPSASWPTPELPAGMRSSMSSLLRHVRREIERAAASGDDWRSVIDSLRPLTPGLWQGLPIEQRARFLRHLRPWWDVHRHRMAPPVHDRIEAMQRAGTLQIVAGRLRRIDDAGGQVTASYLPRGAGQERKLVVQRVLNATGIAAVSQASEPLIRNLAARGLARFDPLGFGFDVSDELLICGGDGNPVTGLWALGSIVRGVFWECVAVPEIRVQAAMISDHVCRMLCHSQGPVS